MPPKMKRSEENDDAPTSVVAERAGSPNAKRGELFNYDPDELVIVGIDKSANDHPELAPFLDEDSNAIEPTKEEIANVKAQGVLEPIIVRVMPVHGPIVVDGRSRVRRARVAKRELEKEGAISFIRVPAVKQRGTDASAVHVMVSANNFRRKATKLEEAHKVAKLVQMGQSREEIAASFGWKSVGTVAARIKLLDGPGKLRKNDLTRLAKPKRTEICAKIQAAKVIGADDARIDPAQVAFAKGAAWAAGINYDKVLGADK